MDISSLTFLAYLLGALVVYHGLPGVPRPLRLLAVNLLFVASFFANPLAALPLAAFALAGWAAMHLAARLRGPWGLPLVLLVLVAAFIEVKRYTIVPEPLLLGFSYTTVGLSYVLFRVLHLVVDIRQGAIRTVPGPAATFNYLFCFLTFVSGPIQRYEDHVRFVADSATPPDRALVRVALERMLAGFVKVMVVAVVANDIADSLPLTIAPDSAFGLSVLRGFPQGIGLVFGTAEGELALRTTLRLLLHGAAFTVYLYANFAGYMDIVLGAAALFGFRLPENFDRPFSARNFMDFWSRWHMTLSNWFKVYLFNTLLKLAAKHAGRGKASAYLAVPAFLVTFLVMGVWHGTTLVFWYYGAFLGVGVAVNKLFQLVMQGRLGKKRYAALAARPLYGAVSRGIWVAYFVLSLSCLWLEASQWGELIRFYGASGLVRLFVVMAVFCAVALSGWDWLIALARRWMPAGAVATYLGFLYLAVIWGNLLGLGSRLESLIGIGLPDAMKAAAGGGLMLLAWGLRDLTPERPGPSRAGLSVRLILLLFVGLTHAGSVPDFVYKGF